MKIEKQHLIRYVAAAVVAVAILQIDIIETYCKSQYAYDAQKKICITVH